MRAADLRRAAAPRAACAPSRERDGTAIAVKRGRAAPPTDGSHGPRLVAA